MSVESGSERGGQGEGGEGGESGEGNEAGHLLGSWSTPMLEVTQNALVHGKVTAI